MNIITFSKKATTSKALEEIHQVFLDGISDNINSLVQSGKDGGIHTTDTPTMGYYVISNFSEAYTLQEETIYDGETISSGELVVNVKYLKYILKRPIGIDIRKINNNELFFKHKLLCIHFLILWQ